MREVFKTESHGTWVYDFDLLGPDQIASARAIYALHNERVLDPPKSFQQFEASGDREYMRHAWCYLLTRQVERTLDDGSTVTEFLEFDDATTPKEVWTAFPQLKGHWDQLVRCERHFFTRTKLRSAESQKRYVQLIGALQGASTQMEEWLRARKRTGSDLPDDADSGNPENGDVG